MIRKLTMSDVERIKQLHRNRNHHELDLSNALYHGVVELDGKVVGYGAVKRFHEMSISLFSDSVRERKEAIDELLGACIYLAGLEGQTILYAFAENEFANLLEKHYGFDRCEEQILGLKVG